MPGKPWNAKEKKLLRRQVMTEARLLAEVRLDGRTLNAIRSQVTRMALVEKRASRKKWSVEERRRLRKLQSEGFTPKEIHEFDLLGGPVRTRWSITKQWGRMKLANRRRSRLMKKKRVWTAGEQRKFKAYLRRHSRTQTPEEIGKVWAVARSTVARWQNALGLKVPREAVVKMVYSQRKQSAARKRIQRASKRMWEGRRAAHEKELLEQRKELRHRDPPVPEQVCTDCRRSWPKRRSFFHIREKKISMGTSRYYKHRCVLCENARRRHNDRKRRKARTPKT